MKFICQKCQSPIEAENVNVATDIAKCTACNEIFKASELMADVDLSENLQPPSGSKIEFNTLGDNRGSIIIPRQGIKASDIFPLIFATFWISFIAFWTWGASHGSLLFAAFSIPFWIIGFGMWRGMLIGITETQNITIDTDTLFFRKKSLVSLKDISLSYSEIESITIENMVPRDPFTMTRYMRHFMRRSNMMGGIPLPTVSHGTKKTHFAENISEAEMQWLIRILKALVFNKIAD